MSGAATVDSVRPIRAVHVLHGISAAAWLGLDAGVAVLLLTGWLSDDREAYRALATFVVWPMLTAGLVCLVSGLLLRSDKLRRYWWVAVKLALNLVLCALIMLTTTNSTAVAVSLLTLALACWPCSSMGAREK